MHVCACARDLCVIYLLLFFFLGGGFEKRVLWRKFLDAMGMFLSLAFDTEQLELIV